MISQKVTKAVAPAEAGAQNGLIGLDSRFRGNDEKREKDFLQTHQSSFDPIFLQLMRKQA